MIHQRQVIRQAVASLLMGKTAAGQAVYATREVPWRRIELPGIAVYTYDEASEWDTLQGAYRRTVTLAVVAVLERSQDIDNALDAIALEIETVLGADPTLGGVAFGSLLTETHIEVNTEQETPVGAVRLVYDVEYRTSSNPAA